MVENKKTNQLLSYVKTLGLILWGLGLSMVMVVIHPDHVLASDNALIGQEKTIVDLTNEVRSKAGLMELTIDSRLMTSAHNKALDMASRGYFDHANPEGYRLTYWITGAGYKYTLAGENLAKGFSSADKIMSAWINSFSHYVNLVEPKFRNVGIGIAEGMYQGQITIFVVQHFGVEQTSIVKVAGDQQTDSQASLKNLISPITNMITDNKVAFASPTNVDKSIELNEIAKAESIDAVSANIETLPPSTGGGNWSMIGLFAVMILAILGYLEEQFNILQIKRTIFLRRISKKKTLK